MTMLERVANALRPFCFPSDADIAARAVLEAIREPTEAMVKCLVGYEESDDERRQGWHDAIDAALRD